MGACIGDTLAGRNIATPASRTASFDGHNVSVDSGPSLGTTVGVLGELEVTGPAGLIEIRAGLPRTLFTMLVARAGRVIPADSLTEELWVERAPANPSNALQVQISYLRRQLRPVDDSIAIVREGSGYRVDIDVDAIDAVRFEACVQAFATPIDEALTRRAALDAVAALDEALAWWRGPAYADAAHVALIEAEHHRLEQRRIAAEQRRGVLLDRLGDHDGAIARLEPLAMANPFREDVWASLIEALYRGGRQVDALRAYGTVRSQLVEELGIEPGPELRQLERAVLAHDSGLMLAPLADPFDVAPRATHEPRRAAAPKPPPEPRILDRPSGSGRLPSPITGLIGRAWEVDEVRSSLDRHRLLTLTGPGGVGKTRLAFEAARSLTWPITVVELGGIVDPASVAGLLANSVPVPTDPGTDPLDVIADRIGDDDWLMLFDTCEHLVDIVAEIALRLLGRCPSLRILATSRQPLHLSGEVVWPVPLLELPDPGSVRATEVGASAAVRLFVERARAVHPSFNLDDTNAASIAAICTTLDGLPLAIELAASRVGLLSPSSLHERLRDRFTLLTGGPRDAAARQRSLQATVEWSVDQLEPPERQFLDNLGVFAGSFGLDAAAAVTDTDQHTAFDILGVLVERSLVISDGDDRFRQLDTLREFSRSSLRRADPQGERQRAAERRLAMWVRQLTVACDPYSHGPLPAGWPRLRAEAANIRTALEWAFSPGGDAHLGARIVGATTGSLALAGDFADAARWLDSAQSVELDDETAATVLRGVAVTELYQGRFASSLSAGEASHSHALATGIVPLSASCAITYGSAAWGVGELARSERLLREAADDFDAVGDVRGRGFALARLARTLSDLGDAGAVAIATAAVDDLETSDDDWVRVVALDHLAYILLATGDHHAAAVRAEQAIALAERVGSYSGRLAALGLLGRIRLASGEFDEALDIQATAIQSAAQVRNIGATVDGLDAIADTMIAGGRHDTAALVLGAAEAIRRRASISSGFRSASRHDHRLAVLREALGEDQLDRRMIDGADLNAAEVVELARRSG